VLESYEKSPAFFRVYLIGTLFEPEEMDTDAVVEALNVDAELDAELDAILAQ
jgi:hypothetical protein